jgi:hypothetical protein
VMVGVIGPMGSGLPQFGFPRRFAMNYCLSTRGNMNYQTLVTIRFSAAARGFSEKPVPWTKYFPSIHEKPQN